MIRSQVSRWAMAWVPVLLASAAAAAAEPGSAGAVEPGVAPSAAQAVVAPAAAPAEAASLEGLDADFEILETLWSDQIEVSSARPSDPFSAPSTVSVVDRAAIDLYGFRSVSQALTTLAGVSVGRTYLKRQVPVIRGVLQDHYANKVLVLINGAPSWMAVTGEGNLDRVDINDVERIEVLRGPASVLYGTNAYAGAINIVLRRPESGPNWHGASVHARAGDRRFLGGGGRYMHSAGPFSLYLSANASDDLGTPYSFVDEDGVGPRDMRQYLDGANLTASAGWAGEKVTHSLLFNGYTQHESSFGVIPTFKSGAGRDHYLEGYLGNYDLKVKLTDRLESHARAGFDWNRRDLPRSGTDEDRIDLEERTDIAGYRLLGHGSLLYAAAPWADLEVGAEAEHRESQSYANVDTRTGEVKADNDMKDRAVREYAVFAQARLAARPLVPSLPLELVLGGRYTKNALFDSNTALRATAIWSLSERASLKLVGAQSYRAPTLFELYFKTPTNTVWGNPGLKPETSNSVELIGLWGSESVFVQALGYYADYGNKIYRVRKNPGDPNDRSTIFVNGGRFAGWGGELEARLQRKGLGQLFASYAFERGDRGDEVNENDHYNFKYIAQHSGALGAAGSLGDFSPSTVIRYVGTRGGPVANLPAQWTWDASLSYRRGPTLHRLSVENLLDTEVLVPEFTRANKLNALPDGFERRVFYSFRYEM